MQMSAVTSAPASATAPAGGPVEWGQGFLVEIEAALGPDRPAYTREYAGVPSFRTGSPTSHRTGEPVAWEPKALDDVRNRFGTVGTDFDAAVRSARELAVATMQNNRSNEMGPDGEWIRADSAQAVLQAKDGTYYVTTLGSYLSDGDYAAHPGTERPWTPYRAELDRPVVVEVRSTTPDVKAVVGASRWVDLREAGSGVPQPYGA